MTALKNLYLYFLDKIGDFDDCDGMVELMRVDSHDHRTEITEKTD